MEGIELLTQLLLRYAQAGRTTSERCLVIALGRSKREAKEELLVLASKAISDPIPIRIKPRHLRIVQTLRSAEGRRLLYCYDTRRDEWR